MESDEESDASSERPLNPGESVEGNPQRSSSRISKKKEEEVLLKLILEGINNLNQKMDQMLSRSDQNVSESKTDSEKKPDEISSKVNDSMKNKVVTSSTTEIFHIEQERYENDEDDNGSAFL